jgi:hypothetical protein
MLVLDLFLTVLASRSGHAEHGPGHGKSRDVGDLIGTALT